MKLKTNGGKYLLQTYMMKIYKMIYRSPNRKLNYGTYMW